MASLPGWLAAGAAYMAADLLTGSTLVKALLLNGANMVGIGAAYAICVRLPKSKLRMEHPASLLDIALASAVGAAAAGIVGGFANPILFGGGVVSGWTFWFATEFVNYVTILPVILSAPRRGTVLPKWEEVQPQISSRLALPVLAVLFSGLAAMVIGGPGAIAFPVPALLWCGLVYPVFPTALLTLLFGLWSLAIISTTYLPGAQGLYDETALISVRLAASLIAIGPIMLAVVMQNRKELLSRLHHLATHDQLTGAANRHAFLENARKLVAGNTPVAVLMIDLDHFKAVNDTYGHAAGDEVLSAFAQRVRACLRPGDAFGRVGGEEFAAVIPKCPKPDAFQITTRIREAVSGTPISLSDGRLIKLTASIGFSLSPETEPLGIERLLASADAALYRAKAHGRDRVEIWELAVPTG
ncbi:GGDEF domain-containing protein [Xaviernesmea oryzae]|nr:GGDEF domain-containing protein [Xaviernesmea oryzae]